MQNLLMAQILCLLTLYMHDIIQETFARLMDGHEAFFILLF